MSQIIEKAKKRLAALEREAEQMRAFIHTYERLEAEDSAPQRVQPDDLTVATRMTVAKVEKSTPKQIVDAATQLIQEKQRPLTRTELVRLLTLRGLRIAGKDLSKNVGTIIWRSAEFENVDGKGYWPKSLGPWGESEFDL